MEQLLPPFPIHDRVRLMRLFAGLTQIELANSLQVSQSWLSKVESGILELSAQQVSILRNVFGMTADAILDGVIPYYEIAKRSGRAELLPARYRHEPKVQMRAAYPFLHLYQKHLSELKFNAIMQKLKIKKFVLADPTIPVSTSFLWDLISLGQQHGIFENANAFQELSTFAAQTIQSGENSGVTQNSSDSKAFFEKWIELARRLGGGHEFEIVSMDKAAAEVEMRCRIPSGNEKQSLAGVFDEYYRNIFTQMTSDKHQRPIKVEMTPVQSVGARSPAPVHAVRYRVRWG